MKALILMAATLQAENDVSEREEGEGGGQVLVREERERVKCLKDCVKGRKRQFLQYNITIGA